jgi:demethylmenaquinone methyltransferase/2-methoxy-6-polyprenyl-1,4-benzoquinol methylase
VTIEWVDDDGEFIRRRYDRIGKRHDLVDWLLFLPSGLRQRAVDWLGLRPGGRVLEIGCGTGPNLASLRKAVGSAGEVYGVDFSEGMLTHARSLCARNRWDNVVLTQSDALEYLAPEPLDGVLFSLSYNTMPHHRAVLTHALDQLRPGGRIVVMDAKLPPGLAGRLILPFSVWLMKRTVLGNPHIRPWEHLAPLTVDFAMQDCLFGSYYVCRGTKPPARDPPNGPECDA